jgi:hypothetical protein
METPTDAAYRVDLANKTTLVLCSWRDALNAVEAGVQAGGGMRGLLEDIRQVKSLCERYSREGFVPLRGDELGQDVGKRVNQLTHLVRDLRNHLGGGWGGSANMATSRKRYTFKTTLHGFGAVIGIKYVWWARRGQSPIWLRIKARDDDRCAEVVRRLKPTYDAFDDKPSYPTDVLLPLPLKLGVERDDVLDDLARQLDDIAVRLRPVLGGEVIVGIGFVVDGLLNVDSEPDRLSLSVSLNVSSIRVEKALVWVLQRIVPSSETITEKGPP